jgi:hypothetical protein
MKTFELEIWLRFSARCTLGLAAVFAFAGSIAAGADERLWATPLDTHGYAAPWTNGPVKVKHSGGLVQICASPNNMSRITYSEDAADLGLGPELDPGMCACRSFDGSFWIRAPWTTAYAASAIKVSDCQQTIQAGTLGSNSKANICRLIPPDGSYVIVGGATGQNVLEVRRPTDHASPQVRVFVSTHLVLKPGTNIPDRSTQGEWPLYPGEVSRNENFNGTLQVYAPDGYDLAKFGPQQVCERKFGISQSYGPPPSE